MSAFVDATSGSVAHCHAMAEQFPELAELYYDKMALYCQQKLWHQLTLVVLEFMNHKDTTLKVSSSDKNTYAALYQHVILAVYKKLNPLALAQMASHVAFLSLDPSVLAAVTEAEVNGSKSLLEQVLPKVTSSTEATLYVQSKIALMKLQYQVGKTAGGTEDEKVAAEQLSAIKSTITANAAILNQILPDTTEATIVHSAHYEMSMTYYKVVGPPEAFYDQAILYLNYYDVIPPSVAAENQVVLQRQHQLAVDLCLAALVGKGVYNLGQIVTNPLLTCLAGTADAWLVELLTACSKGNVSVFEQLVTTTYASHIAATPALMHRVQALQEKMTLLALVQMVFERPSSERTLPFVEIAARLGNPLPMDQVEWVVMRAFSEKLMEGTMDQVDGMVHVTWVMPRVLDNAQMSAMATRFGEWATKVATTKDYMHEQQPELTA